MQLFVFPEMWIVVLVESFANSIYWIEQEYQEICIQRLWIIADLEWLLTAFKIHL